MLPTVSVIVPCYNEQATIGALLEAICAQTYPMDRLEIVIADGLSEDGTRAVIAKFREAHPQVSLRVVDNLKRTIPAGLNAAILASRGEIVVRLDAHSAPIPAYVDLCVQDLSEGKGLSVGGIWRIVPGGTGWIARAIAAAAAHPVGAGDALYRLGGPERAVDTVPFGAFSRRLFDEIGGFDETLLTNEDYEFNVRIRGRGGVIWMDPRIRSTYVARPSLGDLARQYFRYGYWKFRMLRRYPQSLRLRQALPPALVLGILTLAVASALVPGAFVLLAALVGIYGAALLFAGALVAWRARDAALLPGTALAFATMHLAWGSGFLWSLVKGGPASRG